MRVAVLMSTYNGHKYLNEQLQSLALQTIANKMIVYIRDDGSIDNTFKIIERWKEKLNIILYKGKNTGPALSFWWLLTNSDIQADYYAFCDQDDIWDNKKLELAIKKLDKGIELYACNCRIIDENNEVISKMRRTEPPEINIQRLFISGCTQGCSMVFTKKLKKNIERLKISCIPMHDIILMMYALQMGKVYWDQNPRFSYRIHCNNVVAKNNKSIVKKIKTIYWNWNNGFNNSMSIVAKEMLKNLDNISEINLIFLKQVANYKVSLKDKKALLMNENLKYIEKKECFSFRIRVLLNLF